MEKVQTLGILPTYTFVIIFVESIGPGRIALKNWGVILEVRDEWAISEGRFVYENKLKMFKFFF